jgi:hypothetical protein
MSLREVSAFHKFVVELGWSGSGVRIFWTDDNSNYAGVYVEGPLTGRVAYVDHDEVDLSPVFSSVDSFLAKFVTAAKKGVDWHEMKQEPPPRTRGRASTRKQGPLEMLRAKLAVTTDADARARLAMSIMKVTPLDETESIVPFLDEEDMYVQERACVILGERKYEPAVEKLGRVAKDGTANGVTAAIRALGQIGTERCRRALRAAAIREPRRDTYVAWALEESGCEIEEEDDRWRYRLPGEKRWKWLLPQAKK